MKLESTVFTPNATIPDKYTCRGDNILPPLVFEGVPSAARSLVLYLHDPDAPAGDFLHWLIWNIPPFTQTITKDSVPSSAVQGINDFGKPGYGGPCPHSGMHRYIFELYALGTLLDERLSTRHGVLTALQGHVLATAQLIGVVQASSS